MNARLTVWCAIVALLAVTGVGCSTSPPAHFYELVSTAYSDGVAPARYSIMVGPVSVPASVDRPQMVVQVASNRVEVDEYHRWIAPLDDSVARVVAGDLAAQLGTAEVVTAPMANFDPEYRVTIDMQRFESIQDQAALITAVWTVRKNAGGQTRSGRTIVREPVQGEGFDALAAAHSRALAKVSSDIAAAIRAEAANGARQ